MNVFKRYRNYLKDNPQHYWFKRKLYGWGWTPATWQGWLMLLVFLGIFVWIYVPFLSADSYSAQTSLWFVLKIVVWVMALAWGCYLTGEPPCWQWGPPKQAPSKNRN